MLLFGLSHPLSSFKAFLQARDLPHKIWPLLMKSLVKDTGSFQRTPAIFLLKRLKSKHAF
ncbi:hypothetical protein IM40_06445 [Candidatus Paracaedimonas acanthamoebae]|nr:hypothetical protein IM40_06445 [Candidatus Paracaedimonas acanthamoebae]